MLRLLVDCSQTADRGETLDRIVLEPFTITFNVEKYALISWSSDVEPLSGQFSDLTPFSLLTLPCLHVTALLQQRIDTGRSADHRLTSHFAPGM